MRDDFRGPRPKTNGTNGVRPEGMRTRSIAMDGIDEPIDLVAVQADDELISALAAGMSVSSPGFGGYDADDHVAAILAAWKADVDATPLPELVDIDTAMAAIAAGRSPSRRARHLAPVAAAAAFLVLAVGGLSVGSYNSEPGDPLWAVSKVLYSERAESVEAAARVETRIDKAKHALAKGEPIAAAQELEQAAADLAVVRPEEGKTELVEVQEFLVAKAQETPLGTPTDPGAPLVTQPARKVPPGAAIAPTPKDPVAPAPTSADPPVTNVPDPGSGGSTGAGSDPRTVDGGGQTVAPDPSTDPTTDPAPTGGGEGGKDPATGGSPGPSGTVEGGPDPTATPGQSLGDPNTGTGQDTAGGTPTAAGTGPAAATN